MGKMYVKRFVAFVLVFIMAIQLLPLECFSVDMSSGAVVFKPAIDVYKDISNTNLTDQELQQMYDKYKTQIEGDISTQKTKIESNRVKEETAKNQYDKNNLSKTTSTISSTDSSLLKSSLSSTNLNIATTQSLASTASTTSTTSTIEAPSNLDLTIVGDSVDATWSGVEGAAGYKVYKYNTSNGNTTIIDAGLNQRATIDGVSSTVAEYKVYVRAYDFNNIESIDSNYVIAVRNEINNPDFVLNNDYVFINTTLSNSTKITLAGHKLKICQNLNQLGSATIIVGNGQLSILGDYNIGGHAQLIMLDPLGRVYVQKNFTFNSDKNHDVGLLDNGILEIGEKFQDDSEGLFNPGGNHAVFLNSTDTIGVTNVMFNGRLVEPLSYFNYLFLNKALSLYNFSPPGRGVAQNFAKKPIQIIDGKDSYLGFDGVYSPSGNFGRTYTDLVIKTRGENDIEIGRTYNGQNTNVGILGKGWTFSYEASVVVDSPSGGTETAKVIMPDSSVLDFKLKTSPSPSASVTPTPTPTVSPTNKEYEAIDSRSTLTYNNNKYTLSMKDGTKYEFVKLDNNKIVLSTIQDSSANKITIGYNPSYKISSISDDTGKNVTLDYFSDRIEVKDVGKDDNNNPIILRTIVYRLNQYSNIYEATDATGFTLYRYGYDTTSQRLNLVQEQTSTGVWTNVDSVVYDGNGKILTWTDINGMVTNYIYEPHKTTINYTVEDEVRTKIEEYDETYASIASKVGNQTSTASYFTQDIGDMDVNKFNEIKEEIDIYGNKTTYERDSRGNVTKIINPDLSTKEFGYYTTGSTIDLVKWELDEDKNYTYYVYNDARKLTTKYVYRNPVTTYPYPGEGTPLDSLITKYTYNADGQVATVTEPNYQGNTTTTESTRYVYNSQGILESITDPSEKSISYTYNAYRLLEKETVTYNGLTASLSAFYEYDINGRLLRKILCNSDTKATATKMSVERYVYDSIGRLKQKIDPNIYNSSEDTLDASGNITGPYTNLNVGYRYTYNLATENVLQETNPEGHVVKYEYNDLGDMDMKKTPDPNGGSSLVTTFYGTDIYGRDTETMLYALGKPATTMEYFRYPDAEYVSDGNYNRVVEHYTVVDNNKTILETTKYDYAGRAIQSTKGYVGDTYQVSNSMEYNKSGTLKSSKDGMNFVTYYFYNTSKKPVHIWTPSKGENGVATYYTYKRIVYDDSGNIIKEAIFKDEVTAALYADADEKNKEENKVIEISNCYISSYEYYENNKLKLSTDQSGKRTKYYYDGANNVNKIEEYKDEGTTNLRTTDYVNNYLGKVATETIYVTNDDIYGNAGTGTCPLTKSYDYDLNGNLKQVTGGYNTITMYYYDNLNRQIGEARSGMSYSDSSSRVLNWQGNTLSDTNKRGYTTLYTYDWRGFNKKTIQQVTIYNGSAYVLKDRVTISWYDNLGRKVADVSPNNYVSTYDYAEVSGINNYDYFEYNVFGQVTKKGFKGNAKKYNTSNGGTWTDEAITTETAYVYDNNKNMISENVKEGTVSNISEYKYSPQSKIISKVDPENKGRSITSTVSYDYDTLGRVKQESYVASSTNTIGKIVTYEYTSEVASGLIKSNTVTKRVNLADTSGVLEISKYDILGNMIEHSESKGGEPYTWYYSYNNLGKVSMATEPYKTAGVNKFIKTRFRYDILGNLAYKQRMNTVYSSITDAPVDAANDIVDLYTTHIVLGQITGTCQQRFDGGEDIYTSMTYDKNGNILTQFDGNDVKTTWTYDEADRKKSESVTVNGVVQKTTYDCDLNGNLVKIKDWRNNEFTNYYDAMNRLFQKKDQKGKFIQKLEYNKRSLQVKSYDANNNMTEFQYDKNGRQTKTIEPITTHTQTITYDNLGNVQTKTDGKNNVITYVYDIMNRVTDVKYGGVIKASYTYYIDGAVKEKKLGGTYTTLYTYYPNGEVEKITDPTDAPATATPTPTTTPTTRPTSTPTRSTTATATKAPTATPTSTNTPTPEPATYTNYEKYEYYPDGTLKSKVDRNSKTTDYTYDCHGRLLTQITKNAAGTTSTTITVPNTLTDMGYDGNGNLKKIIIEKKVGGVVKSTITTVRAYDALNRVTSKTESTVEGTTTYSPGTITYQYDIVNGTNELKELDTYPGSITVQKIFDVAGRLRAVINDSQQTDYTYDDNGRRSSIIYNSKFKQSYTYYADGQLNELVNAINVSGTYVDSEKYKYYYDNADNISRKDETVNGPLKTTNYTYDNMNRLLTVAEGTTKTTTYTYDSRGNRDTTTISITGGSPSTTYTKYDYRANNSLRAETIRNGGPTGTIKQVKEYKYDGNGNLLSIYDAYQRKYISVNTYTLLNELDTSMVGTNTIFNTYNAEGQRVKKTLNTGAPERYFYEGDKVVFQYANNNSITAFNVIGTNLISRKIGTTKVYYFYNGHGDVTALLDATTNKTRARYAYDAFGNITFEKYYDSNGIETTTPANMVKSQVRFGEYQYDSETEYKDANNNTVTGLYYLNARHYDPGMARFLEVDTYTGELNDPLSLNLYTYCHNEPLMYSDPSGHFTEGLTLYKGMDSTKYRNDILELQRDLTSVGKYTSTLTGKFDQNTEDAVNAYKDYVIPHGNESKATRGKVGATTWLYLKRDAGLAKIKKLGIGTPLYNMNCDLIWESFRLGYKDLFHEDYFQTASKSGNAYSNGKNVVNQILNFITEDPTAIAGEYGYLNRVGGFSSAEGEKFVKENYKEWMFGGYSDEKMEEARLTLFRQGILKSDPYYDILLKAQMEYYREEDKPTWSKAISMAVGIGVCHVIGRGISRVVARRIGSGGSKSSSAYLNITQQEVNLIKEEFKIKGSGNPRTFVGKDEYVAEVANKIEAMYPNSVYRIEQNMDFDVGKGFREIDIILNDGTFIQVKSGQAGKLNAQMKKTKANFPNRKIFGLHPDQHKYNYMKEMEKSGNITTDSIDTLINEFLKYLGE